MVDERREDRGRGRRIGPAGGAALALALTGAVLIAFGAAEASDLGAPYVLSGLFALLSAAFAAGPLLRARRGGAAEAAQAFRTLRGGAAAETILTDSTGRALAASGAPAGADPARAVGAALGARFGDA